MNARPGGGGPLTTVIADETRSASERAVAASLRDLVIRLRRQHTKRLTAPDGSTVSLTIAQLRMLFHLPDEGAVPISAFAATACVTPASATQALAALEELGVVTRTRSQSDRRVVNVELTEAGLALRASAERALVARWDEHVAVLPEEDFAAAARVLAALERVHSTPES